MTHAEKALAVLRAIAVLTVRSDSNPEAKNSITFSGDWGFGSGTIHMSDGSHSHFGGDFDDDPEVNFQRFVDGAYDMLCEDRGLSFTPPNVASGAPLERKVKD